MIDRTSDLQATLQHAIGQQYRLEREVGRGGMGVVFLATDLTLDRRVAVKVIHPDLVVNRAMAARFLAEARLIARVRHAHIVAVHAAGEAEGHIYYVMDYLPGETLRQRLTREGPLDAATAVKIAGDIAAAVDAAATAGLVHRDLKPENILLEGDPALPTALLADFGIARLLDGVDGHTGPGAVMGTPAYMSPEQAAGEPLDSRSDLYALGVVAYEMLTGEPPFTGPQRIVVSKQIADPPPVLGARRPGLPDRVVLAVMRALEKVPEARFASGAAFRRALLGEPTPAAALPPPGARLRAMATRWLVAAGLVGALGLGGLAWALWPRGGPPAEVNPRHSILVLPFDNLRDDAALRWLTDGSVSMLTLALSQWNDLSVVDQARVHDLLERAAVAEGDPVGLAAARRLAREAGAWTVVLGDFERAGDSVRLVARVYDVASGVRLDVVRAGGSAAADVRAVFDDLAARLLDLSGAPEGSRTSLAAVTTGSLAAYRAYLQGLVRLNHWELDAAERHLRTALALDSTFGLAWYKLAQTRGWLTGTADTAGRGAVLLAARWAERLPSRERRMIEAYRSLVDGEFARSQALYGELVAIDSADADAWYGLGDATFHDPVAGDAPAGMTRSLRAFRRALTLDPNYALAYEHISYLLTNAASPTAGRALVGTDSFTTAHPPGGRPPLDSTTRRAAAERARVAAVETARGWVAVQPGTARAHRALYEAYLAAENWAGASQEAGELRRLLPAGSAPLTSFLEARVRFSSGDYPGAAELVRTTTTALGDRVPPLPDFGRELVTDVMTGASVLAYVGDLDAAAQVVALGDALRRSFPTGAAASPYWDQEEVWEWARLAQLYSAAGGPEPELRRLWGSLARASRRSRDAERAHVAGQGAAAAAGLLLGPQDPRAVRELESLTGRPSPRGVVALAALARGDSAGARRALADTTRSADSEGSKGAAAYWGFAMGDPRPLEAEARYQLGEYQAAVDLLTSFDEGHLNTRGFDARWGLLPRVRLLRALAYERLGRPGDAEREFRQVVARWQGADLSLVPFVQEAQKGLARLRGARG